MKKLKIAALGVAALGFAAAPAGLTFAADGDVTSVTETVTATVSPTCGLYDTYTDATKTPSVAKSFSKTMVNGELWNDTTSTGTASTTGNGATYIVVCNDEGGWNVKAIGSGTVTDHVDYMAPSSGSTTPITSNLTTTGATASWAFKIKSKTGTNVTVATDYNDKFAVIPTSADTVVSSSKATDKAASFTTAYQVYIGTETPAGTYTGQVTYTLAHPAN